MQEALFSHVQIDCILGRREGNKIHKMAAEERLWNTQSCQEILDRRERCVEEKKNEEK